MKPQSRLNQMVRAQRGFSLIEVLIACVVLAIGLLGLAGLQVTGMRNNQTAYLRSQAIQSAYDIADRMRANQPGVSAGRYNNQAATTDDCDDATDDGNVGATCSVSQLAGFDLAQWAADLTARLPSGAGTVCIDSTPDDGTSAAPACDGLGAAYAVKIWWDEDRQGAANQRFVTSFQP